MDRQDIWQKIVSSVMNGTDPLLGELYVKWREESFPEAVMEDMINHFLRYHHGSPATLYELDNKIERLESKVFPSKKNKPATRTQRMLILYYMGFFDSASMKKITSNRKRAALLSSLLDISSDNIMKDLTILNVKQSDMKSVENLEFVKTVFEEVELKEIVKEIDKEIRSFSSSVKRK